MAYKDLSTVSGVQQITKGQSLLVVAGNSIKQIEMGKLIDSMNVEQNLQLRTVAWGTYLEDNSSTVRGQIGNLSLRDEFKESVGRYFLRNDGRMAKLNRNNSNYCLDGTPVDWSKGHCMWWSPMGLYQLVQEADGKKILWLSTQPIGGEKMLMTPIGAFKGAMRGNALASIPNAVTADSKTMAAFWEAAQMNGKSFGLSSYQMQCTIVAMFTGIYGDTDCQKVIGNGLDGTGSDFAKCAGIQTGKTLPMGDSSGKANTTDSAGATVNCVSFLGLENKWGQKWEFAPGITSDGAKAYIYEGNVASNTKPPLTLEYREIPRIQSASAEYITRLELGKHFDIVPKATGGGSTTNYADGHWSAPAGELWIFGGDAGNGSVCGLSASNANYGFSVSDASIGARLAFYGDPVLVSGRELMV